jgi:hypothetical protein
MIMLASDYIRGPERRADAPAMAPDTSNVPPAWFPVTRDHDRSGAVGLQISDSRLALADAPDDNALSKGDTIHA